MDRSRPHYGSVMQWVGLFLFGQGLTTFSGRHRNHSLLLPMEDVFEDFVTLLCLPFDVASPEKSIESSIRTLEA